VIIEPDFFWFQLDKIYDGKGGILPLAYGYCPFMKLTVLRDFSLDIDWEVDNLLACKSLRVTRINRISLFYGRANVMGFGHTSCDMLTNLIF